MRPAAAVDSTVTPNNRVVSWIQERRVAVGATIRQIPLSDMRKWQRSPASGNVVHDSGRFFSIEGIGVETDWGNVGYWEQPIINQPEIGYLGLMAKKFDGHHSLVTPIDWKPRHCERMLASTSKLSPLIGDTY
jgi:oxidase EvaA